ncbi:MAG: hypothetical protein ABW104_12510 [Candidatus Thiodiazotropha sp. 6PLUC2]
MIKNILIFIAGGASLIAALFGWNYYEKNVRDAHIYQGLGEGLSRGMLREAVIGAETYKLVFGFYPETIKDLRNGYVSIDPALRDCECKSDYFHQLNEDGKSYYLFSKGRDCVAFTPDDIHPELTEKQKMNIGLVIPTTNISSGKADECTGT